METIHQIIIESVSGGFWRFCGYWIMIIFILRIPSKLIMFAINRPLRHYTLRKTATHQVIVMQMVILNRNRSIPDNVLMFVNTCYKKYRVI